MTTHLLINDPGGTELIARTTEGDVNTEQLLASTEELTDEEILKHRRMHQSDYMVEAQIVETLDVVRRQLREVDEEAHKHIAGSLLELQQFIDEDLEDIEKLVDEQATGVTTVAP